MSTLNQAQIIGYLGNDPKTNTTSNGDLVATISVATTEKWKDKQGNQQEDTQWHRIVFFGRQAEVAAQYLRKGSQVFVQGQIKTRKWQDNNGNDRYTTEIVARQMTMLGGKGNNAPAGGNRQQQGDWGGTAPNRAANPPSQPATPQGDDMDDIPF